MCVCDAKTGLVVPRGINFSLFLVHISPALGRMKIRAILNKTNKREDDPRSILSSFVPPALPQVGFLITIASSAPLPSFCSQNIATQDPTVCPTSLLGYEGTAFYRAPSFICQQSGSNCSLAGGPPFLPARERPS